MPELIHQLEPQVQARHKYRVQFRQVRALRHIDHAHKFLRSIRNMYLRDLSLEFLEFAPKAFPR